MRLCNKELEEKLNVYSKRPQGNAFSKEFVFDNEIELDASVIIPCYNSEEFLEKCLESVLNQKSDLSYEVIAVNDGSVDKTAKILDTYKSKFSNLVVITQENKGFSGARNSGIKAARGRYLLFVDSDDYVEGDYINNLVGCAKKNDLDIAACGHMTFRDSQIIKRVEVRGDNDRSLLNGCFWAKAFKREIFDHIIFPEGYWYEDSILAHLIYPKIKTFASVGGCFYAYRSNEKGITISSRGKIKSLDTFYISDLMIDSVEEYLGKEHIKSQEYFELIIEQFYLNQSRIKALDVNLGKQVFDAQAEFVTNTYDESYKPVWKYQKYVKALRTKNYKGANTQIKLEKIYKVIELILRKFGK